MRMFGASVVVFNVALAILNIYGVAHLGWGGVINAVCIGVNITCALWTLLNVATYEA